MTVLSHAEARAGLKRALQLRHYDVAWHVAQGLVAVDPQDYAAQAGLAQSAIGLRRSDEAKAAARRAQGLARTTSQKFEADLLRAQAAGLSGSPLDGILSGFWARRATDKAPHESHRALALSEARRLRNAAPLEVQLALSVSPSGNVNNGSERDRITLPGWGGMEWQLAPQSRALSGWYGEGTLSARYRLSESATHRRHLNFVAYRREVTLSSSSRRQIEAWQQEQADHGLPVPETPNYDYGVIELGLSEARSLGAGVLTLQGAAGHSWYGGQDLSDHLRLEMGYERALSERTAAFGTLSVEQQWGKGTASKDQNTLAFEGGAARLLGNGDRLKAAAVLRRTRSDSLDQAHDAMGVKLAWSKASAIAGVSVQANLGAELRRYDASMMAPGGRRDLRLDTGLSLGMEKITYMGFVPQLNLSLGRVGSNVKLYEGNSSGLSIRLRSVF